MRPHFWAAFGTQSTLAVTLLIRHLEEDEPLSLSFDAPRIVVGRSSNCDVILPDPTVSSRHASLRHEGSRWLLVDEGSSNGIVLGNVRLSAHTPRAIEEGSWVRIGRHWLEVRLGTAVASPAGEAQRVARAILAAQLAAEGEAVVPELAVESGTDEGRSLLLDDTAAAYLIGRAAECQLSLTDELVSRRHAEVSYRDGSWWVRDFGSKRGTKLAGQAIQGLSRLEVGRALSVGATTLSFRDPLADALVEALASPDLKMSPEEFESAPPGQQEPLEVVAAPEEVPEAEPLRPAVAPVVAVRPEVPEVSGTQVDLLVAFVALGLLGVSIAGLWWLLG